ncbi:SH3 domain-containing protein [Aestuariispira insulae]|uniref:SH3-like domain-containing protein n=1 Tax=Aestuariispira insulae TaxID=1461337 RepID=A0A3D9H9Q4_9PROT|nr:SH3 domain-containing protein [Aestuariispira insulae]RED46209.1 SH3-like domain-containing protein [Aestuariispira insulae]
MARIRHILFLLAFVSGFVPALAAWATSLPVPRMVSLRADEVNVRSGPGVRYPVKWVFQRRDMPVEIIAEYDTWRKIRDWEGAEGWVHRAMVTGRRTIIVLNREVTIRRSSADEAPAVARLGQGMVARAEECGPQWCYLSVRGYEGWVRRQGLWGIYEDEIIE